MPSRRPQISATERAFAAVSVKPGRARRDRSVNSCTASNRPSSSLLSCALTGNDSDGTRQVTSPGTPSGSRLVARSRSRGQASRSRSATSAQRRARCSQLSSTSSSARSPIAAARPSRSLAAPAARTDNAAAIAPETWPGSVSGASSTSHTPSGRPPTRPAAACSANRVLPQPPEPVSVTRRCPASRPATLASSSRRPTKLVSCTGRLWRPGSRVCGGGKDARKSGWLSCHRCSGGPRSGSRCQPRSDKPHPTGRQPETRSAACWDSTTWPADALSRMQSQWLIAGPCTSPSGPAPASPACRASRGSTGSSASSRCSDSAQLAASRALVNARRPSRRLPPPTESRQARPGLSTTTFSVIHACVYDT
jgi:hypothetical protein